MSNALLTLGITELAESDYVRPDYELTRNIVRLIDKNRCRLRPNGDFKVRYPDVGYAAYQHEIKAGPCEGVLMFETAAYLNSGGAYCHVYGLEGDGWRLLVIGDKNDVRRRYLIGDTVGFNEWVSEMNARARWVKEKFDDIHHDIHMRLRCGFSYRHDVSDLEKALATAVGDWMIINNKVGRNYHIELEREEDLSLLPAPDFVIGTNWQAYLPELIARKNQKVLTAN